MEMDQTYIVFRQKMERAEDLVIIKLEAFRRLQLQQILRIRRCLWHFLRTALRLVVVPMRILGRDPRPSPAAPVVVVGVR